MPEILTTKEIAKYLKLHEITIYKLAGEGKIPAIRIGKVWRFDKEVIDKWISGDQKKAAKKTKKVIPSDTDPNMIKKSRKGINSAKLKKNTEIEDDNSRPIIYKLRKKDKTKRELKGVFEKA
jgi:excisionase family DNA binding protein